MSLTEVRCPNCNKLLFKADGGYVERKCDRCKTLITYDGVTNIVRNKGTREYSMSEDYKSMRNRVTSSGHRFE